ncbi:MAG: 4Fe-4S binding protein [Spirochaetales bacterium]|nr:4Fe-4S binding protein [Spirochaetales bacterium]
MGCLGFFLSTAIALAHNRLKVAEDPLLREVRGLLPGNNCGACGEAGCSAFARALLEHKKNPSACTVAPPETRDSIAHLLGVAPGETERRVARLACAGGRNVARQIVFYEGQASCRSAALVGGGGKGCSWGCLGLGDCAFHCEFEAISMNPQSLPVVDSARCTACGDCVEVCPRDLFSLLPVNYHLFVACKSLLEGEAALADCRVACTGCGLCAADAPDLIHIEESLARINYNRIAREDRQAIERCPTGAIVWLDENQMERGYRARIPLRKSPLPTGAHL